MSPHRWVVIERVDMEVFFYPTREEAEDQVEYLIEHIKGIASYDHEWPLDSRVLLLRVEQIYDLVDVTDEYGPEDQEFGPFAKLQKVYDRVEGEEDPE